MRPSRRCVAARRLPRTGTSGDVHRRARGASRRSRPRDARADRGVARALPHPLRHVDAGDRGRARRSRRRSPLLDTYEAGGRRLGADERARRRQGPRSRPLRAASRPTSPRTPPTSGASRRGLRPARLRPRRRSPRLRRAAAGARRDARLTRASRSRCSCTSSCSSSRAARRGRCRSGAATSSSSTSCSTRSASTRRAGTSSRAATIRRSSSTSISPRNARNKNPVYYVQYAHARIAGILRNADGTDAASARAAIRCPLEPEERELVKRLLEFPAVVARGDRAARAARDPHLRDPRRRRLPPLLPRAPRARVRAGGIPPRPRPRGAARHRALPRSRSAWTRRSGCRIGRREREIPDRNLALELVRVTESAATFASRWIGRGDKIAADQAAVDAMRLMLDTVSMRGVVVIGEGEKDEAPMLYNGEEVGDGTGPEVDVAVDPLEGTRLTALGHAERDRRHRRLGARDDVLPRRSPVHGQDRGRPRGGGRDRHRRDADREPRARRRGEGPRRQRPHRRRPRARPPRRPHRRAARGRRAREPHPRRRRRAGDRSRAGRHRASTC